MGVPYQGEFRVTKLFGTPPPAGVKYANGTHSGADLVGSNKNIYAIADGTVFRRGFDPDGWGNYCVIQQKDALYAIYCHMSAVTVNPGQRVFEGDRIGSEGATGQVTGPHLHLEIRKNYNDRQSVIDPLPYIGIENKVGKAVQLEVLKKIEIILNGKKKTVDAIEKSGYNYIKLQDLRDEFIEIGYNGKPVITVKK